jgi:hypothetical protein
MSISIGGCEQMKKQLFFAVAVVMLLSCPCRARSTEPQSRVSVEICKLESDLDRAILAHDDKLLTELFADEYLHTNFIGRTTDKKAELEFFASPEFLLKAASIDSCTVHVYRNVAVATGVNNWTEASYRGRDISGLYRFTTVYVLRKGHWQIVVSHASKITSP